MKTVDNGCHNPVLVALDSHDPRCNAHGHQLLEQQLAGIRNLNL